MHDLVIRGGTVVDGSGCEAKEADVAIDGNTIVAVGSGLGAGKREIDARGKLVTPGFVDVHTHYDAQVTWDPMLTPSSWHGCTTVVMGNCGVGFAPVHADRHEFLIELMEGVEDIPGSAMVEGIEWSWETFPEYMTALEKKPHVMDFGVQVPHGALRAYVMGERGAKNEAATPDDVRKMAEIVKESLLAGALGFSTSRTSLHKSKGGDVVPGTYAARDELFGIGSALAETGRGVFQLAGEHIDIPKEMIWMRELAEETKRPVCFNLSQTDKAPELWREVAGLLDAARAKGIPLHAQVAGRSIGILMCWEGTAHPFVAFPTYIEIMQLPFEDRMAKLRDPAVRAKLLADTPFELWEFAQFITQTFDKMYVVGRDIDYEPPFDRSIAAEAGRSGRSVREIAFDALMADDGHGMIYFPLFNYSGGSFDVLRELHQHPSTRMGLSDAGAHCGAICDGGMPTFMLTHWTRDRTRGERLPLPFVIHRQTRQTAELYGLFDRGLIAPGMKADVNVIDYDKLGFGPPRMAFDLPAKGRRLVQRGRGYDATVCSGVVTTLADEPTGELPGVLLRGPQGSARG